MDKIRITVVCPECKKGRKLSYLPSEATLCRSCSQKLTWKIMDTQKKKQRLAYMRHYAQRMYEGYKREQALRVSRELSLPVESWEDVIVCLYQKYFYSYDTIGKLLCVSGRTILNDYVALGYTSRKKGGNYCFSPGVAGKEKKKNGQGIN